MQIRCPHCQNGVELVDDSDFQSVDCPSCGSQFGLVDVAEDNIDTLRPGDDIPEGAQRTSRPGRGMIAHFELIEEVGRGAFGSVWRARDTELDRTVAVKVPRPGQFSASTREQFLREARAAAQLSHPNIIAIHEVGRDDDRVYIVSDFVDGISLDKFLASRRLSPSEAATFCIKVTGALEHAHQKGVIHRDLKPSNIMLPREGQPQVMDFGLAKREAGEITMTIEGKLLGTPAYMPPEQARGEGHNVDRRADIYSLGVILYELLTGEVPFRGTTRMLLQQVIYDDAPSPRKLNHAIPRDLETITLKCLEKDPAKRYDSCEELAADLQAWLDHKPIQARPVGRLGRLARWCTRKPAVAALSAAVILLLLAGTAVSTYLAIDASREAFRARTAEKAARTAEQSVRRGERELRATVRMEKKAREEAGQARDIAERALEHAEISRKDAVRARELTEAAKDNAEKLAVQEADQRKKAEEASRQAQESQQTARRQLYASDMLLAKSDLESANMTRLRNVLQRHKDDTDLIGFEWHHLNRLAHAEWQTLSGIAMGIRSISISPDEKRIATASDMVIRIWDAESGEELMPLKGHQRIVRSVAFNHNGTRLVSAGDDKTIRVWDTSSGEELKVLTSLSEAQPGSVAISNDGKWIVFDAGNSIAIWDAESGTQQKTLEGHAGPVTSVAISHDNTHVVSGSYDRTVKVWDIESAEAVQTFAAHNDFVYSVAVSQDGRHVVSGSKDKSVRVWDKESSKLLHTLHGHTAAVTSVAISSDGKRIVSGSDDNTIKVWDAENGQDIHTLRGHEGKVLAVAISRNGERIVSGSGDRTVKFWDAESSGSLRLINLGYWSRGGIAISPDSQQIVCSDSSTIKILDLVNGIENRAFTAHQDLITSIAISHDGTRIITGSEDKKARAWDYESGQLLHSFEGHTAGITSVAISRNGERVVTGSQDNTGKIWDLASGKELHILGGHTQGVTSVAISPDGTFVVTGSEDLTLKIWNPETGEQLQTLSGHDDEVHCVSISADNKHVISGSRDKTIKIWDIESGLALHTLTGHTSDVISVTSSKDGKRIVSGSRDNLVKIWDAGSGQELYTLAGASGLLTSVTMANDGKRIVAAVLGGPIRIWEAYPRKTAPPPRRSTLPGIDLTSFPDDVKQVFFARCTSTMCPCGCEFNLADCRVKDSDCEVSLKMLTDLADQLEEKKVTTADAAAAEIDAFFKARLAEQK